MGTNFFEFRDQVTQPKRKPTAVRPLSKTGLAAETAGAPADRSFTVTQLTNDIDRVIRGGFPSPILVRGEVSNYRPNAASGHVYFTLKDSTACISCVMWKSDAVRVRFTPTDGMELLARGNVQVYAQQGKYQLYVTSLQPLGQGALELAFQQTRAKLEAEGLFSPARKRPLPMYPSRIVLVTSTQTAALQDMLKVLRRFPWVRLFVYHVPVQGEGCGQRIADALRHLSSRMDSIGGGQAEVILLSRGGGSLEDLWGFNEEAVARAIADCPMPVVTGIGHEVDTSIADLVADHHAHTPTEAAQVVTAHWRGARDAIDGTALRLRRAVRGLFDYARQRLFGCERHEVFRRPLHRVIALRQLVDDRQRALESAVQSDLAQRHRSLDALAAALAQTPPERLLSRQRERVNLLAQSLAAIIGQRLRRREDRLAILSARLAERHPRHALALATSRLDQLADRLDRGIEATVHRQHERVNGLARHLDAISPERVLQRGYSITTRKRDGAIVRKPEDVKAGERLVSRVAEGSIESTVDDSKQPRLFE